MARTPAFSFVGAYPSIQEPWRGKLGRFVAYLRQYGLRGLFRTAFAYFPVTIVFCTVSLLFLILGSLPTRTALFRMFSAYFTSYTDPWMYLRLVTSSMLHANALHFTRNFSVIVLLSPVVERKYGSGRLFIMMAVTAFLTGLAHVVFVHNARLLGASDIAYMLIMATACLFMREKRFPLIPVVVGVFYIGSEFLHSFSANDGISHISHVIGGLCGVGFGVLFRRKGVDKRASQKRLVP